MDTKKLVALRKEAEKAIAEMPDGDLKVKAFEVILGHLLGTGSGTARQSVVHEEEDEPKPAKKGRAAKSATARILVLREEGFFKNQRSMGEVSAELAAHGWHYPLTALSGNLQALTQRREIRRVRAKKGNKKVWLYSEP
jgi:hypothetical protein